MPPKARPCRRGCRARASTTRHPSSAWRIVPRMRPPRSNQRRSWSATAASAKPTGTPIAQGSVSAREGSPPCLPTRKNAATQAAGASTAYSSVPRPRTLTRASRRGKHSLPHRLHVDREPSPRNERSEAGHDQRGSLRDPETGPSIDPSHLAIGDRVTQIGNELAAERSDEPVPANRLEAVGNGAKACRPGDPHSRAERESCPQHDEEEKLVDAVVEEARAGRHHRFTNVWSRTRAELRESGGNGDWRSDASRSLTRSARARHSGAA